MNRLPIVALLAAVVLIPLGTTWAQEGEAKPDACLEKAWAKLQAAVKEGKMSAEDADAKMIAIKKAKLGGGSKDAAKKDIDYEAIGKKLKAAVQAGKLTKEEAKAKWAAIKKAKINAKK